MKLHIRTFDLELKHTFRIATDTRDIQKSLIVGLEHNGKIGYGEATANKYYDMTIEAMIEVIEEARPLIETSELLNIEDFMRPIDGILSTNSFARCAVEVAAHDLYGQLMSQSIQSLWNISSTYYPITNYTIGIDSLPNMTQKITEFPWPIYKIKLGTDDDLGLIRELRKHTDSIFRVDSNCAWTVQQTIDNSIEMKKLNVELIEQPIKADNWKGMKEIYEHSALPLFADESCIGIGDVAKCIGHFHGINIKLMKCGGMIPARKMIEKARSLHMKVMMGCMTESSVGISAISQFLPLLDYVDMDGPLLISNDIGTGPVFNNGRIELINRFGNGVVVKENFGSQSKIGEK